jgi:hypothetical protein
MQTKQTNKKEAKKFTTLLKSKQNKTNKQTNKTKGGGEIGRHMESKYLLT